MSNSIFLGVVVCVFAGTKMCKVCACVCLPGDSTGPNCNSVLLAAVTIGYNLSEPSVVLVYSGIKPRSLCGKLKRTSSDTTAIHNHLDTLTKDLTMPHLLCLLYFFSQTLMVPHPTVNASRSIWHYNCGELCIGGCIVLLRWNRSITLAGSQCMSLTMEDLDWGIGSLCNIPLWGALLVPFL